jgi:hypothetical protein
VHGAENVARTVLERGARFAHLARPAIVNGTAGLLLGEPAAPFSVAAFAVANGRITSVDILVGPTLGHLD